MRGIGDVGFFDNDADIEQAQFEAEGLACGSRISDDLFRPVTLEACAFPPTCDCPENKPQRCDRSEGGDRCDMERGHPGACEFGGQQ